MLILTRKVGESIVVNDGEIRLSIVQIRGNRVRLAIEAPASVPIRRQELVTPTRRELPVEASL